MQDFGHTNSNKTAAKTLGWCLMPVALLALPLLILSIAGNMAPPGPRRNIMGVVSPPDPVGEHLLPMLPFYFGAGLLLWLILFISGIRHRSPGPSWELWAAQAFYQLLGSLLFCFLAYHYSAPQFGNVGAWRLWLYPLIVTVPALLFSSYRLYRVTISA